MAARFRRVLAVDGCENSGADLQRSLEEAYYHKLRELSEKLSRKYLQVTDSNDVNKRHLDLYIRIA